MDNLLGVQSWLVIYRKSFFLYVAFYAVLLFYAYLEVSSVFFQFILGFAGELQSQTFDYIIIGGGTAGALLAARLSEQESVSVLLLEAGTPLPYFLDIPVLGTFLQRSAYDWEYLTEPQEHACFGLKKRRSRWPAGRALGGTSQLNNLLYVPGYIKDYDEWKLLRKTNLEHIHWSLEEIRQYFDKAKTVTPVKEIPYSTPLATAVLAAAKTMGFKIGSLGLDSSSSFGKSQVYLNPFSNRWTPADYLMQAKNNRTNLVIRTGASVTKILIKEKTAYGVEVVINGKLQMISANKEVILSAGTIGSPHLLMRSGIGPRNVLQAANIEVLYDLPVGKNLQDHVTTGLDLIISRRHLFGMRDLTSPTALYNYFLHGKGPFTSTLCEAVGILQTNDTHLPELAFLVMMAGASSDGGLLSKNHLGIRDDVWQDYFEPLFDIPTASIMPVLLHPKSSGEVRLNPKNPAGPPLVNPNYLAHNDDVETLVDGLQFVQKLVSSKEMRKMGFSLNEETFPGCEGLAFGDRKYWACYVRQLTLTSYHPVGTCRMGHRQDLSVVDHLLKVYGFHKLRVVDASVIPNLMSGNPQAALLMIVEKAADLIKNND